MPLTRGMFLAKLRQFGLSLCECIAAIALTLVAVACELKALDMLVRLILN